MRQTPSQDEQRRGFQGLPGCWALLVLGSTLVLAFEVPLPPPVYSGFCSICSLPLQPPAGRLVALREWGVFGAVAAALHALARLWLARAGWSLCGGQRGYPVMCRRGTGASAS